VVNLLFQLDILLFDLINGFLQFIYLVDFLLVVVFQILQFLLFVDQLLLKVFFDSELVLL